MTIRVLALMDKGLYLEALIDVLREIDPAVVAEVVDPAVALDVDALALGRPQVLLLDVENGGDDDVSRLRAIAANLEGTRVIAVGSTDDSTTIERLLDAGAAGYLPRSFMRLATLAVLRLALNSPQTASPASGNGDSPAAAGDESRGASLRELGLTDREIEVLALAAQGKTNAAIAQALGTAEGTVRIQMSSILGKLNVGNRSEAIVLALRMERVVWEQIRKAETGSLDLGWLLPHMEHRFHKAGYVLFRKDDIGKELYYLQHGRVQLPELGLELKEKDLFGELGMFASARRRTSSAKCATDVDLFALSEENAKRLYFLNPAFAMFMMSLVAQRLVADRDRVR